MYCGRVLTCSSVCFHEMLNRLRQKHRLDVKHEKARSGVALKTISLSRYGHLHRWHSWIIIYKQERRPSSTLTLWNVLVFLFSLLFCIRSRIPGWAKQASPKDQNRLAKKSTLKAKDDRYLPLFLPTQLNVEWNVASSTSWTPLDYRKTGKNDDMWKLTLVGKVQGELVWKMVQAYWTTHWSFAAVGPWMDYHRRYL